MPASHQNVTTYAEALTRLLGNLQAADLPANYVTQAIFEAVLDYAQHQQHDDLVAWVTRNVRTWGGGSAWLPNWRQEPFSNLLYSLGHYNLQTGARDHFLAESEAMHREHARSADGAILHQHRDQPGRLLIDRLQAYLIRCAQASALTGSGFWCDEVEQQLRLYRRWLYDPASGLWRQGRGWGNDPEKLSPGAWSRGQAWVLRGLVLSREYLPSESTAAHYVVEVLCKLAETLLHRCDDKGLWHALVNLPPEESSVDTSGSGMIAGYLWRAVRAGSLPTEPYAAAATQAVDSLLAHIGPDGTVASSSPGPGPLVAIDDYYRTTFPSDEPHGRLGAVVALTEILRPL